MPDFRVRATILAGQTTELAQTPAQAGECTVLCDVFCGTDQDSMDGTRDLVT